MDSFTPGPWTCDPDEPADYSVGLNGSPAGIYAKRPDREDADDDPILLFRPVDPTYWPDRNPDNPDFDHFDALYHGDMDANMTLAAAAPDLLAALEGVVRVANRETVEFDAARAAIAKARGDQP